MKDFSFSWVDLVIVALVIFGITRGRKRGMSEECLDIIKWAGVVVAAGFLYEPLGGFLADTTVFSLLACYVAAYIGVALMVMGVFALIRSASGRKLVSSDMFGEGEYYLGMMAGGLRYACVVVAVMALLNARLYSSAELAESARFQEENFGSIRFPTLGQFQAEVFRSSFTGRLAKDYLSVVLIRQTSPNGNGLDRGRANVRAREWNELDKR